MLLLTACASDPLDDATEREFAGNAHPAAYSDFGGVRPLPQRRRNDFQFYYKHCQQMDRPNGWSATSYDCTTSPF